MKNEYATILCVCTLICGLVVGFYNGVNEKELLPECVICQDCDLGINVPLIEAKAHRLNSSANFKRFFSTDMTLDEAIDIYFRFRPATTVILKNQIEGVCACE